MSPSQHGSNSGCTLDEGDILGHPVGVGGADLVRASPAPEGTGPVRPVGGGEHSVEEDIGVTEVFNLPTLQYLLLAEYNPYDFSEGQALHSPADPTLD